MSLARGTLRWVMLGACLAVVALPRFGLHDPGPIKRWTTAATATSYGLPIDVEGYIRLAKYFRGQAPADSLIPPYSYRPLVPWIASWLPFDVRTAIDVIDVICLALTVFVLDRFLKVLGFGASGRNAGCLLFIVSFPTFYYGAIGFVDPAAVLCVTLAAYLVVCQKKPAFVLALIAAVLVKETNAAFALLPASWSWARRTFTSRTLWSLIGFLTLAGVVALAARELSPSPDKGWLWNAGLGNVRDNLGRPRAYLSLILTLGLPSVLAVAALWSGRARSALGDAPVRFLTSGCLIALALYVDSVFAAYADGRVIWILYPFAIPLAVSAFPGAVSR